MRVFEQSPFWIATRQLWSFRFVMAVGLILLTFEAVARVAPHLIGRQVHQRYLYSDYKSPHESANKGKTLSWLANERGARGDIYHGEPVEIAVLGSSTSEDAQLDQQQCWTQRLDAKLGRLVHVDNYALDGATQKDAFHILRKLRREGRRCDILLLMVLVDMKRKTELAPGNAFRYWGNWVHTGQEPVVFPRLLYRRLWAQKRLEPKIDQLFNALNDVFHEREKPSIHPHPRSRSNRKLRLSGQVTLVDEPYPFGEEEQQTVSQEILKVLEDAAKVADLVYWITQPVAYDENESPGVPAKWFYLVPVEGEENAYYSNKSIAEWIRKINAIAARTALSHGTHVIDLDGHMRTLLRDRDDLFEDKWHFAPAGADVAAQFVARSLRLSEARTVLAPQKKDGVLR